MEIFATYLRMRARIQLATVASPLKARPREPKQPRRERLRKPRVFRPRQTLEGLAEEDVVRLYRLPSAAILSLYELVKDEIEPKTRRTHAVPGISKLLSTLHFLASGSFQPAVAAAGGFSQPTFCRFIFQVIHALLKHIKEFIYFPRDQKQWLEVKQAFYAIGKIPNVMGAIDCTHVPFTSSHNMDSVCHNTKHCHCMNMQVVCDANHRILNVFAAFPASANNSDILQNSSVFRDFEESRLQGGWLLGDSKYGSRFWLLTPISQPRSPADQRYNQAHQATCRVIEQTFDILKSRFQCLDRFGGTLQYSADKVCEIFTVCCMLHNICIQHNLPVLQDPDLPADLEVEEGGTHSGSQVRANLIRDFFS